MLAIFSRITCFLPSRDRSGLFKIAPPIDAHFPTRRDGYDGFMDLIKRMVTIGAFEI